MKYLLSTVATCVLLIAFSVTAQAAPKHDLSCDELAVSYAKEAETLTVLRKELVLRIAKDDRQQLDNDVQISIMKLTYYLQHHMDKGCDNANFVKLYAETIFPKPDEYLSRYWQRGQLDGAKYCASINTAVTQLQRAIYVLSTLGDMRDMDKQKGFLLMMLQVATKEGYGVHHSFWEYISLYIGTELIEPSVVLNGHKAMNYAEISAQARRDIDNLTPAQMAKGQQRARDAMYIYEDILIFQSLRSTAFSCDIPIKLSE